MPSSYTLGMRFEAFVKELVASGRYNNASEVLRDGLRLLEERERLREIKVLELRRLAEEGRLSGLSEDDGEAVLDRLEAKYRALAARDPGP
jgi:antitoxin ParD1/3/4